MRANVFHELAQDAHTTGAFERAVLDVVLRAVPGDVAFFLSKSHGGPPTASGLSLPMSAEAALVNERELSPLKAHALTRGGAAVDEDVFGAAHLRSLRYFRAFAAPVFGQRTLLGYLRLRSAVIGVVGIGRCSSTRFREEDVAQLETMLPALAVARASYGEPRAQVARLTDREREVLELLCLGYTNKEIAQACGTSPNTVRNQLVSVFGKLGASTRAEAVAIAKSA